MTATALLPVVFAILGALVYALSANPKLQELGRLTFAAGMFALAFAFASKTLHLFG